MSMLNPTREFLEVLTAHLVVKGHAKLPLGSGSLEDELQTVINTVWNTAAGYYNGGDRNTAATLAEVLNQICPNPNTGAFDGFHLAVRNLPLVFTPEHHGHRVILNFNQTAGDEQARLDQTSPLYRDLAQKTAAALRPAQN